MLAPLPNRLDVCCFNVDRLVPIIDVRRTVTHALDTDQRRIALTPGKAMVRSSSTAAASALDFMTESTQRTARLPQCAAGHCRCLRSRGLCSTVCASCMSSELWGPDFENYSRSYQSTNLNPRPGHQRLCLVTAFTSF